MKFHFNINKSAVLFINQVVYSGKSFLLAFVLARFFEKDAFGIYSFVIIGLNNYLGFLNSLVYEPLAVLSHERKGPQEDVTAYLFRRQNQINLLIFLLFGLLAVLRVCPLETLGWIFLFLIGSQVHEFFKRHYLNKLDTVNALYLDVVLAAAQLGILGVLFWLKAVTLNNVFAALFAGCLPTLIFGLVHHRDIFTQRQGSEKLFDESYWNYVKPNFVFSLINFASGPLNNFVIFFVLGSVGLAHCEAARLLVIPLHLTILAMGNVLMPYFSRGLQTLGPTLIQQRLKRLLGFFGVVFLVMGLVIIIPGPFLLELFYQSKYTEQLPLLGLYTLIYVFDGMNMIVTYYLKALGSIHIGINIRLVLMGINLIVLIPLIVVFKEAGGLLATLLVGIGLFFSYYGTLLKQKMI